MSEQTLYGFSETGKRWGVSPWTVRRAAERGELKTVNIGARRMIPLSEIRRVEEAGIGTPRARRTSGEYRTMQPLETRRVKQRGADRKLQPDTER